MQHRMLIPKSPTQQGGGPDRASKLEDATYIHIAQDHSGVGNIPTMFLDIVNKPTKRLPSPTQDVINHAFGRGIIVKQQPKIFKCRDTAKRVRPKLYTLALRIHGVILTAY